MSLKIVLMYRPDCPTCKELYPVLVEARNRFPHIAFKRRNSLEDAEFLEQYDIRAVPTLLFFNDDKLLSKTTGSGTLEEVLQWIDDGTPLKYKPCAFCLAARSYMPKWLVKILERFDAR